MKQMQIEVKGGYGGTLLRANLSFGKLSRLGFS